MKKFLALTLALVMVLAFAACSKAPASNETGSKTWIIAMDTVFRPFEYTDENGEFVGIDVDIINAVAKDQGLDIEIRSLGWDAAIAACQAGQADGMIAGASIKQDRIDSGWIFSDGYYTATQTLTVAADSDITGWADLKGKSVAVKNGTAGADYAASLADEYGFTITTYEDSPSMYQAVTSGVDAGCVEDTPIMKDSIVAGDLALKVLDDTANEGMPYGFAIFDKHNQELIDAFNKGLANIKASGEYDQIIEKYLGK